MTVIPMRTWDMREAEGGSEFHSTPTWEPSSHILSPDCHCCPVVDYECKETGIKVWKHHCRGEAI